MEYIISIFFMLLCRLVNSTDRYRFSNFDLQPDFVILNSTSTSKLLCTKEIDDKHGFEISTIPTIISDNLRIYENRLNNTAMEITIQSIDYIGAFNLICSSIDNQSVGIQSDVLIGTAPGIFTHVEPCIVYENQYIDCIIRAPIMIAAIHNRYPYSFDFMELHQSLVLKNNVYQRSPKLIRIDDVNKTLTFRWLPVKDGVFPSGLKMSMRGALPFFGSTNFTMDMTPNFWIKPNFTIEDLSPTYIQVHFNHDIFPFPLFCRGSLTTDEKSKDPNEGGNSRIFRETNETTINITHLIPNTWYQLCFRCRRNASVNTISEVQCIRKRTERSLDWLIYLSIISLSSIIIIIVIAIFGLKSCIKVSVRNCINPGNDSGNDERSNCNPLDDITVVQPLTLEQPEPIGMIYYQVQTNDTA